MKKNKIVIGLIGEKGAGIWPLIDKDIISFTEKNIANPWA